MTEIKEKIPRPFVVLKFLPTRIAHIAKAPRTNAETNPDNYRDVKECCFAYLKRHY